MRGVRGIEYIVCCSVYSIETRLTLCYRVASSPATVALSTIHHVSKPCMGCARAIPHCRRCIYRHRSK